MSGIIKKEKKKPTLEKRQAVVLFDALSKRIDVGTGFGDTTLAFFDGDVLAAARHYGIELPTENPKTLVVGPDSSNFLFHNGGPKIAS